MEFLVDFELNVPEGTPEFDVKQRESAEAAAAGHLAREGHLIRLWRPLGAPGETKVVGLYRADSDAQLESLLGALPIKDWMQITITPLEPHPNDPTSTRATSRRAITSLSVEKRDRTPPSSRNQETVKQSAKT